MFPLTSSDAVPNEVFVLISYSKLRPSGFRWWLLLGGEHPQDVTKQILRINK